MKLDTCVLLAKKYGKAFLRVFGDTLSQEGIHDIAQAEEFLAHNKRILFYLRLPAIEPTIKVRGLDEWRVRFNLGKPIAHLVNTLLAHKRIGLLRDVLKCIVILYRVSHRIMSFSITSSHQLADQDVRDLEAFLARKTGSAITYDYRVDPQLIAGIRMQSDTMMWEYSVQKILHEAAMSLAQ